MMSIICFWRMVTQEWQKNIYLYYLKLKKQLKGVKDMKRTSFPKMKVDAILTSDWHMMEKERNPPCRTDNHFKAQMKKVKEIYKLQKKYDCQVLNAGDIFEHWKGSPELINNCLRNFPKKMKVVAGQHDLPQHSMDLLNKSSFESLRLGGAFQMIWNGGSWGADLAKIVAEYWKNRKIIVAHMLIWKDQEPYPGCIEPRVNQVFKMFPDADLILTGDNHQTFTARKGKQLLVNPGSLTRHKADQINHKPCVFLWNASKNSVKKHYLKIKKDVISRDHIDEINEKEERGKAFISSLNNDWLADLSFDDNVERSIKANSLNKSICKFVYKWIGR